MLTQLLGSAICCTLWALLGVQHTVCPTTILIELGMKVIPCVVTVTSQVTAAVGAGVATGAEVTGPAVGEDSPGTGAAVVVLAVGEDDSPGTGAAVATGAAVVGGVDDSPGTGAAVATGAAVVGGVDDSPGTGAAVTPETGEPVIEVVGAGDSPGTGGVVDSPGTGAAVVGALGAPDDG